MVTFHKMQGIEMCMKNLEDSCGPLQLFSCHMREFYLAFFKEWVHAKWLFVWHYSMRGDQCLDERLERLVRLARLVRGKKAIPRFAVVLFVLGRLGAKGGFPDRTC